MQGSLSLQALHEQLRTVRLSSWTEWDRKPITEVQACLVQAQSDDQARTFMCPCTLLELQPEAYSTCDSMQ